MLKRLILPALVVGTLLVSPAPAGFSPHLDDLGDAVQIRLADLVVFDKATRKQDKGLRKSLAQLAKDSSSYRDDLKVAAKVSKLLDKAFPADREFGPLLDTAITALRDGVTETRDTLDDLTDRLGNDKLDRAIAKGVAGSDKFVTKADTSTKRTKNAKLLSKARGKLAKARRAVEKGLGEVAGALYIGGAGNLTRVSFVPVRQTGETEVLAIGDTSLLSQFSDGAADGSPGNFVLTVRFRDAAGDGLPDNVDVSFFRLAGVEDPILAWGRSTFGVSLAVAGFEIRVTPTGTVLVFDNLELTPLRAETNSAERTITLNGTLPLNL